MDDTIQRPAVVRRVGAPCAVGVGAGDELVRDVGGVVFVPESELEKFLDSKGYCVEKRGIGGGWEARKGVCIIPVRDDVVVERGDILSKGREEEGRCS